MEFCTSGKQQR